MIEEGCDACFVRLLAFWYSNQTFCVAWQGKHSSRFTMSNGTRQGGVISPYLFTRYIRPLILALASSGIGCNIGGMAGNNFAYADDMVLLAPSCYALQDLIRILEYYCVKLNIICNTKKTVCMVFKPRRRDRWITEKFPAFTLRGCE